MNRGAGRQVVFHTRHDGELFESLTGAESSRAGVEVHAYCLMPNHFHLLVHCPDGGLSTFMQQLAARFTRATNQRAGRDGALFRGRFHSIATDDPGYVQRLGRYIHRNPVDLTRVASIEAYRWSSLRAYLEPSIRPQWLRTDVLADRSVDTVSVFTATDLARLIDLLMAAHLGVDGSAARSIRRAVSIGLTDGTTGTLTRAAPNLLGFPSVQAARHATRRARGLDESAGVRQLVEIIASIVA